MGSLSAMFFKAPGLGTNPILLGVSSSESSKIQTSRNHVMIAAIAAGFLLLSSNVTLHFEMERPPPLEHERNWDATFDLTLRRFVYGSLSGAASAMLLFRSPTTRWAAVAFGAGAGVGSALTDASQLFRGTIQASSLSVSSPSPAALAVPDAPSAPPAPKLERFEEPLIQEAQDA